MSSRKIFVIATMLILQCSLTVAGQERKKTRSFKVRLVTLNGDKVNGKLTTLNDSSVVVETKTGKEKIVTVSVTEMKSINVRRKNTITEGVLLGATTGFMLGFAIGYASYDGCDDCLDFGPAFDGAVVGIPVGITGLVVGAMIGASGKRFKIDGDQSKFEIFVAHLKKKRKDNSPLPSTN